MVNVQRLADDVGGESLNVKPQANGGRKILTLLKWEGLQIVYALGNASGYLYDIFYRVASIGKYVYIINKWVTGKNCSYQLINI